MKNYTSLIAGLFFFLGLLQNVKAQYVTIPDANFRAFLQGAYPACFNASGQLDTTCSAIPQISELVIENKSISDLTGVKYFTSLKTLNCSTNSLSVLPTLPASLTTINCFRNQLTNLSALPASLSILNCEYNKLTSLPKLPAALTQLDCDNNALTALPFLPQSLSYLSCSDNQLTSLPILPPTLGYLACNFNNIVCLPRLTNNLGVLYAANNPASCLPNVPTNASFSSDIGVNICANPCISGTSGTNPAQSYQSLTIMPNPSTGVVSIQTNLPNYTLADIIVLNQENEVVHHSYNTALAQRAVFDFSGLPKGIYIVQITAGEVAFDGKMIIE